MPPPLLLDLDGTLIDSEPWYKATEVKVLNDFGAPITLADMHQFTGLTLPTWLKTVNQMFGTEIQQEAFLDVYRPKMEAHVRENVEMFPDGERLLDRLGGSPAVLVTSSMAWYVRAVFDRFPQIEAAVSATVCEADVQRGKPDPEPYLMAARFLSAPPDECWVVEDAPNGVTSGLAAGCRVWAVDRHSSGTTSSAHRVVASLDEIVWLN